MAALTALVSRSAFIVAMCFALAAPAGACEWFRRGDTDGNGAVELTDGVATLNFLFLGGPAPACEDAADADDSGDLALVDAVATFNFLFLGGSALAAPGPFTCGPDPSEDRLFCFSGCEPPAPTFAADDFEVFAYEQRPGLGFCPDPERVFAATIVSEGEGLYRVELTLLVPGDPDISECLPIFSEEECLVAALSEPRVVEAAAIASLLDLFAAVPIYPDTHPICECIAIDPCVIPEFSWDDLRGAGFECFAPRLPGEFVAAVREALEMLRAPVR